MIATSSALTSSAVVSSARCISFLRSGAGSGGADEFMSKRVFQYLVRGVIDTTGTGGGRSGLGYLGNEVIGH